MRTRATYRTFGDDSALTAAKVTQALGVAPSDSWEVADRRGQRSSPAEVAGWRLSSGESPDDDVELEEQLWLVLHRLIPLREALWGLVDSGYSVDWFCYLGSHPTEHAAELSRELMQGLLQVPGDLLLDVYDDHPDDDQ